MTKPVGNPFRYFNSSPEVIRLVVMMYMRFPLSLRNVEDLLFERGIDICRETVRLWWNRFGPLFASGIRRQRINRMKGFRHWRWHLDEMYVKINGEQVYLWRAVDHKNEVLESYVTRTRDKKAALAFMKKALKRRERAMLRFRQMKALQKFASAHANFYNHFSLERHLVDRQTFKLRRSAALTEWQLIAS